MNHSALHGDSASPPPQVRQPAAKASTSYRLARVEFNMASDAELAGAVNALQHELAACGELDAASAEVCRCLVGDRLQAALDVRAGRIARFKAHAGPDPRSRFTDSWGQLARQVREQADLLRVFEEAGYPLTQQGREWGGPCFSCGGHDRMRLFPEPSARQPVPHVWCRRCGLWGDSIHALRNLYGSTFYAAVTRLAEDLGLPIPSLTEPDPRTAQRGGAS